jgi:transposase InsO family protein
VLNRIRFNTDHGCQYTSAQIAAFTHRHDLARSVGRTGVWDNAAAESFWAFGRIALRKPHLRRLSIEGEGRSALRQAECRLAVPNHAASDRL